MKDFFANILDVKLLFTDERIKCSAIFLLITFIVWLMWMIISKNTDKKKLWILSSTHILYIGVACAVFSLFLPCFYSNGWFVGVVDSITSTVKLFGFDYRASALNELVFGKNAEVEWIKTVYVSFISVFAPFLTVKAVFNIFKETKTQAAYFLKFGNDHIFSELNEKSICLARDIRKNDKKAVIVFTGVSRIGSEEAEQGLIGEAISINALLTKKSIFDFNFAFQHHLNRERTCALYLIDKDETDNVKNGITLFKKYNDTKIEIHVFSSLESSESFIDNANEKWGKNAGARLNLINQAQIIAYDLLAKHPMYLAADKCGTNTMSVLVIGTSDIGMECIKAAMWCGKMNTYGFKIRVIDSPCNQKLFDYRFANLGRELKKSGVDIDCQYIPADINSSGFIDAVNKCCDANYIVVATNNDEKTINTASLVHKEIIRSSVRNNKYVAGREPTIIPIISNIDYYEIFAVSNENDKNTEVFYPHGCYCDIYKINTITEWSIDEMAKIVHSHYNQANAASNDYSILPQTEKRSNRANAVHTIYKLKDVGIDLCLSNDKERNVYYESIGKTEIEKEKVNSYLSHKSSTLTALEHDRWSVFQIMDGWENWSLEEIKSVFDPNNEKEYINAHKLITARLHGSMVPNDQLSDLGKTLYNNCEKFYEYDKKVNDFVGLETINEIDKQLLKLNSEDKPHILIYVNKESLQ